MGRGTKAGGRFAMSRESRPRKVHTVGGASYVKSRAAQANDEVVVMVSVSKLDKGWAKDEGFYIPKGGGGAAIGDRREKFQRFQRDNPKTPVEMPSVNVGPGGKVSFRDGRHRFSVLRDQGKRKIPVTVDRSQADALRRAAGAD